MRLIDVHAHVVPDHFPDNPSPGSNARWPCMHMHANDRGTVMIGDKPFRELDARSWRPTRRIEDMDRDGVSMQALSPMPELLSYWFSAADGLAMARWMNDRIAEMVAAAPTRFCGLGAVPLQEPALAAKELTKLSRDGFRGVEIGSNINGVPLGDARFEEFWHEAARLGMAVFVHALHPVGSERLQQGFADLIPFGAFPVDTALSALTLIRAGVPLRHPNLRLGFSHGGGAIVPLVHRLGQGWKVTNGFAGALPEMPIAYAQRMFYDSLVYEAGYLEHLARVFAPGQVFGGTDYPYAIMESDLAAALSGFSGPELESLRFGAAERFLGIG